MKVFDHVATLSFERMEATVAVSSPIVHISIVLLVIFALLYIRVVICAARFHDMDMSGWHCVWLLLAWGAFFFDGLADGLAGLCPLLDRWRCLAVFLCIAGLIICIAFGLVLLCMRGTQGRNRFGERTQTFRDMFRRSAS